MKLKKLLASILCVAMVLSTMSFTVFAEATVHNVANDTELADAIKAAVDGDTIKLAAGDYTGGISVGKNITLEGSVDEYGNPTSVFNGQNDAGSYYKYSIYMNKGTIKNIKIVNAWKGIMTEGKGNLTIDNVTVVGAGYGIHIAEAKNAEDTVLIQNSRIDVTWANSFAGGPYTVHFKNNVLTSESPYYTDGSGSPAVNSFATTTIIEDNIFGENAKILIREEAKDGAAIGTNYYADGVNNALYVSCADSVQVETYYTTEEMDEVKQTPKGSFNSSIFAPKITDPDDAEKYREKFGIELEKIVAQESVVIKIYSDDELLATTSLRESDRDDESVKLFPVNGGLTANVVIDGRLAGSWDTEWATELTAKNMPTKLELWVDGFLLDTTVAFGNDKNKVDFAKLPSVKAAARIGSDVYETIQEAVDAATAENAEIILFPGTYDEDFTVTQKKNVNIVLKSENQGDVTLKGTMTVDGKRSQTAGSLTVKDIVFDAQDVSSYHYFAYEKSGTYSHNITFENCKFYGTYDYNDAWVVGFKASKGGTKNVTFDGCESYGLLALLQVSNCTPVAVTNCYIEGGAAIQTTSSTDVTFTNNVVDVVGYVIRTGQNSDATNTKANITFTGNNVETTGTVLDLRNSTSAILFENNEIDAVNVFTSMNSDNTKINEIVVTEEKILDELVKDDLNKISLKLTLGYEMVEPGLYDIIITGSDNINELVAAEITFENNSKTVANEDMQYEIIGANDFTVEKSIQLDDTFGFRLVDGAERKSGKKIVIGQVKFHGMGNINFTATYGKAVATKEGTNIEDYYTTDNASLITSSITNGGVVEAKRDVVVNVAYNHALENVWTDSQITVTLKDGFGNVKTADITSGIVTFEDVQLGRLTVTLEAPGFRKFVYNTTLEEGADEDDALVLNFWNNVKRATAEDPEAEIEEGKGLTNKNFLVGDIVMDYIVDKYDLAAVTSYYGMYGIQNNEKFLMYDLNRDGNIDIIDVAFVLHTLNN